MITIRARPRRFEQVTASVVSLGGGVLVGMRSFESSAAMEALDKMEKPTAQAEALAARIAGRAFAWGTAVSIGTAALTVLAMRYAFQATQQCIKEMTPDPRLRTSDSHGALTYD